MMLGQTRRNPYLLLSLPLAALLAACFGDERVAGTTGVGNPPQGVATISIQALSGTPPAKRAAGRDPAVPGRPPVRWNADGSLTVTDLGGTRFTIRRSLAHVGRIRIKLPDDIHCSDDIGPDCADDGIHLEGARVADLMTGTLSPDPGSFKLPVGGYRQMEIRLEEAKEASVPEELIGSSMLLSGTFDYQGDTSRTFSIRLDFDEEIRFESGSADVREGAVNQLVLRLHVEKWMAAADITRCLDDGSLALDSLGNLAIDERNVCGNLEGDLKDGVKSSGNLDNTP